MKLGEEIKNAKVSGSGNVSMDVNVAGGDVSYKNFRSLIEGDGNLSGAGSFAFNHDANGLKLKESSANLTTHLNLKPGTKLSLKGKNGKWNSVNIQGNQSHIHFSLQVIDKNGKPFIKEAKEVDVSLEIGEIEANILGMNIRGRGKKTLLLQKGTIRFLPEGIDVYGNLSIRMESSDTEPLVSIRWN
jgi:hypothetical protein